MLFSERKSEFNKSLKRKKKEVESTEIADKTLPVVEEIKESVDEKPKEKSSTKKKNKKEVKEND